VVSKTSVSLARAMSAASGGECDPQGLNPVENVWQYLRQNQLSLRVWPDYDAIVATCCEAWNTLMAMPDRLHSITHREWAITVNN
jgi:hypothetical protein